MFFYNNPYVNTNFNSHLPNFQDAGETIYKEHDDAYDYKLVDGETLIVEEEGIIASIGAVEEAPAEEEVEAEEKPKEEMGYATKQELQEVKDMVEEIKAILEPKEDMSEDGVSSVKSEETTTKTVYAEKEEMSEVEKVSHNPESESKKNTNLYSQKRKGNTLDKVMNRISNFK